MSLGRSRSATDEPASVASRRRARGAVEVLGDPRRVAPDAVDVRGRQLDQALQGRPSADRPCPSRPVRAARAPRTSRRGHTRRGPRSGPPPAPRPAAAGRPSRGRPIPTTVGARSRQLAERLPAGEPGLEVVPEADLGLAALPAQPDLAAVDERRDVDKAVRDVAKRDAIASIRATPAAIWSTRPCIRSRTRRSSSASTAVVAGSPPGSPAGPRSCRAARTSSRRRTRTARPRQRPE